MTNARDAVLWAALSARRATVLGAGIQGVTVALALADAGFDVTLVDEARDCLQRASLRNEGKIHLGFVYAHDGSNRTAALMLESALAFGPLLEEFLRGPVPWDDVATDPFTYLVLEDSLVPMDELLTAWTTMQATFDAIAGGAQARYLGQPVSRLWQPPRDPREERTLFTRRVSGVVETVERAVRLDVLSALLRARIESDPRVHRHYGHRVRAVTRTPLGFRLEGTRADGGTWVAEAPIVVNCLWDGRLAIDREMGLLPRRPWVYRLKYRLLGRLPDRLRNLPSVTMMLGRFGDVVNFGDGRVYLSWYPT
jgi:2-polyprenyl-6-methoxyphenol hydroxylase-like FAD-dependent oxidoreductase